MVSDSCWPRAGGYASDSHRSNEPGPSQKAPFSVERTPMSDGRVTRGHGVLEPMLARFRASKANSLIRPEQRAGRILDFGCGQGRLLGTMLNEGFDATGVEKHEGMRAHAQNVTGSTGRVRFLQQAPQPSNPTACITTWR